MSLFTDRIEKIMKANGITQEMLAEKIGVTQTTISRICRGEAKRSKYLPDVAAALGVTEQWLLFGEAGESNAEILPIEVSAWDSNTSLPDDQVAVPYFADMSLSAGYGAMNDSLPYIGQKLWFSKSFLKRRSACFDKVFCIKVNGDSMSPVFEDGGVVMIDMMSKDIIDGKAYAINYQDADYLKYLRRLPDNKVRVISANPEYEPFDAPIEELQIIGRIIQYSKEL